MTKALLMGVVLTALGAAVASEGGLVRSDFAFDGMAGYLGWEALSVSEGGAASADLLSEKGPDGGPVMRISGTAKACTFKTVRFALVGGEPYRLSARVRTKGLGRSAGLLSLGGLKVRIPGDTDGKWARIEREGPLPKATVQQHALSFGVENLSAGAFVDISAPKLEPLSEKAVAGSAPVGIVAPMTARLVPVEPLLSAVDARTGFIRFRANVPTNGCEIVATVDGKPLGPIAEGRHEVVVKLIETATGRVKVENTYPFLAVVPKLVKPVGRRLNNFVVEVVDAELKDGEYRFENPRKGWVFIGFDKDHRDAQAFLDGIEGPVITYREGEPSETMRYLDAGAYTLTVKGAAGGRLRIHLIKPVMVGFLNSWREGGFKGGTLSDRFGYEFMRRNAFASMADVNIRFQPYYHRGSTPERRAWVIEQLRLRGKRPLAVSACSPGESKSRASLAAQRKLFVDRQTFRDGYPVSYDENGLLMSMRDLNCCGEAAWEMASMLDPRPIYMDWFSIQGATIRDFDPVVAIMSANVNAGLGTGYLVSETYIGIHAEEAGFEKSIRNLKDNQRALASMMPEVGRRIIHNLSGFQQIGSWTSHLVPQVDRKVAMERLVNRLATDPDFAEVGGLSFTVACCGEELLRWGVRLIHHYAIEGRTDSISDANGWKYFPGTVADGDFLEGLAQWKATAAEDGSLTATSRVGFARSVQKRNCAVHEEGDFFAVLTRSAKGPNRLSQTVRNLIPGRRYVLEYACSDLADVEHPGAEAHPDLALRAEVVGMPFDGFYTVEDGLGGSGKKHARVRSVRHVFRATAAEAELVFSDWATETDPGGAVGRALTLNYIAVTPYFEPAPGTLEGEGEVGE